MPRELTLRAADPNSDLAEKLCTFLFSKSMQKDSRITCCAVTRETFFFGFRIHFFSRCCYFVVDSAQIQILLFLSFDRFKFLQALVRACVYSFHRSSAFNQNQKQTKQQKKILKSPISQLHPTKTNSIELNRHIHTHTHRDSRSN